MRRRYIVLALILLLLLIGATLASRVLFPAASRTLQVLSVRGDVRVESASGSTLLAAGARVQPGQSLKTGHEGEAVLLGHGNSTITVGEHSTIVLDGVGSDGVSKIRLQEGRVRSVVPEGGGGGVEVTGGRTPATMRTRGGDIATGIDGGGDLAVAAFRGTASLESEGKTHDLKAGEQAVARHGKVEIGSIPTEVLLKVAWPDSGKTREPVARVSISAPAGSTVRLDDRPVTMDSSGHAALSVPLKEGDNRLRLEANDVSGHRREESSGVIVLDTKPPPITYGTPKWK